MLKHIILSAVASAIGHEPQIVPALKQLIADFEQTQTVGTIADEVAQAVTITRLVAPADPPAPAPALPPASAPVLTLPAGTSGGSSGPVTATAGVNRDTPDGMNRS
jgi:hypothetical protein